ncbi:hypothetical protein NYE24_00645 [Paenibacillus sp. FSL H7-0350]|uniref:ArnT family glycosyltransferase n=1 Tax=Paenibacillus sp. FSL H7-0350 TaxID=2975345 RepID=UPI003158C9FA
MIISKFLDKKIIALVLIFLCTIIIRYENIFERPLGFHNEDATSHVLVTMNAFDESPLSMHYFLPIFTLGEEHNKGIDDLPSASKQDEYGNYYYTSFPPLGFIAPYIFAKIFFLPLNLITLRIFNVILGLLSALLIYFLVKKITSNINRKYSNLPIISAIIYMFNEESLWSHSNAYWAHSLLQPIWITSIYLFLNILQGDYRRRILWGLGVVIFLMCYTEWTAYIMAFLYILTLFHVYIRDKRKEVLVAVGIVGGMSFLSGILMVSLFSAKVGFSEYFHGLFYRASQRKGHLSLLSELIQNYWVGFGLFLFIPLVLLIIFCFKRQRESESNIILRNLRILVVVTWIPMLENVFLLEHAALYTFATLKLVVPIILTTILILMYLNQKYTKLALILVCIASVWSVRTYFYINNSPQNDVIYKTYIEAGTLIKANTKDDEIAFLNRRVRGHLIYYAERNIVECGSLEDAVKFMRKSKFATGKYYIVGGSNFGFEPPDSKYLWEYYGYSSGFIEISKNGEEGITIYPAKFNDNNWINGISKEGNGFFVSNSEILTSLKPGNILADQSGGLHKITSISNDQVWFGGVPSKSLVDAKSFKLVH